MVHTSFRPLAKYEPVAREDPLSLRKLEGDGTPAERKIVLGWLLDTREFKIYLPAEKALHWITDINSMLQATEKVATKKVESLVGRLNHVGYIMSQARYFLNRIRHLLQRCIKYGPPKCEQNREKRFTVVDRIPRAFFPKRNKFKPHLLHQSG